MYVRDIFYFSDSIEVEEKHSGRYGAPGERRRKRQKPTPEQIAKQNQWRRERDLRRLLKANFAEHDYWITLTYRRDIRPDMEKAKRDIKKMLRKLRDRYKKQGAALKYILVTEKGQKGAVHHHAVVNRIENTDKMIAEFWQSGKAYMTLLYKEGGFKDLANYIAKRPSEKSEKWFSRSRNMLVPKPDRRIMKRKSWKKEPTAWKGYCIEKESLYEGVNPVTGHPYRYYTMVRRC